MSPAAPTAMHLRAAIAEALYTVSAYELADVCDELGFPPAGDHDNPMNSKRTYVKTRLKGVTANDLIRFSRTVIANFPDDPLADRLVALLGGIDGAGGVAGQMKNIIFAATGTKPQIVLQDAINNDVRIVEGADRCLVYDRPVDEDGLSWRELTRWWSGGTDTDAAEHAAALDLFRRLEQSVANSPERLLLRSYSRMYRERGFGIPAILPQVYLHYDPYSASRQRLFRQRMDFLLLLPQRVRIVLELDGRHHYSDDEGRPSTTRYAEMVREDRQLRLAGYEIYRFGGQEFVDRDRAQAMLSDFFAALLDRHQL